MDKSRVTNKNRQTNKNKKDVIHGTILVKSIKQIWPQKNNWWLNSMTKYATHLQISSPSIGTILCAERWCCLSRLLGYQAQFWTGRHSDTVYQHAGTHLPTSEGWQAELTPPGINSTAEWGLNSGSEDPKLTTLTIKPTPGTISSQLDEN